MSINLKEYLSKTETYSQSLVLKISIANAVAVYLILAILQPFGISDCPSEKYLYLILFSIVTFIGSFFPSTIAYKLLNKNTEDNLVTKKYSSIMLIISVFVIACGNFFLFRFIGQPDIPYIETIWNAFWQTLVISILILGVKYWFENIQLRKELERISNINSQISKTNVQSVENQFCSIEGNGKNSSTELNISKLLFIESDKNYCKITSFDETITLRSTLSTLEEQLKDYPNIVRCHRAFLVNTSNVERIDGSNSSGLKLKMKNSDDFIPISRTYSAEILQILEK